MLGDTSIKEASFLPEVKTLLLKQLFKLMDKNDWYSWKELLKLSNSKRSKARVFVDDVRIINFQLGRYLETAALLISALYLNTTNGRIFSSEEAIFSLLNQSNDLFSNRTPAALSPRIYLDTMITDDTSFTKVLEDLRSKLVASYCRKRPQELDTQLLLLSSLDLNFYSKEIIEIYLENLSRINSKVSPRFREELRTHYLLPDQVKDLVEIDPRIGESIKVLYSDSIHGYLDQGDVKTAKSVLLQLASFTSDREGFEVLSKEIEEQSETDLSKEILPQKSRSLQVDVHDIVEQSPIRLFPIGANVAEKVSGSFYGYSLVFALLVFVAILIKRVREFLFSILLWAKNRLFTSRTENSSDGKAKGDFTDELDASIKSGKTVPMASITRAKSPKKKVVNS